MRRRVLLLSASTILVLCQFVVVVAADSIQLRGGGSVAGEVKRVEQAKVPYAVVKVDDRLKIAIPESQINKVADAEALAEYRDKVRQTGESADEHYELARWCRGKTLLPQYRHHMQRAISIDPDHAKARAALNYVQHEGKWIRYAELQQSRGLILVAGRYRLPEEVALRDAVTANDVEAKRWTREIIRLRLAVMRGGDKAGAAMAALVAINDPNAASAMATELVEGVKQPQELRLFWIERLASFRTRPALEALVRVSLKDGDSVVREKALETLAATSPSTGISNFLPLLSSNDNNLVNRAANCLSYFANPELSLSLVDALVTQHKTEIPADQSTTVGFGSNGGGLSTGGKAKVIVRDIQNPAVLDLLRELEPNANFGYDELAWRQYFASRLSGYAGDMRRDP